MEVAARGKLMPRVKTDGFNKNQIEAESEGEGEHRVSITLVVSCTIFLSHHVFFRDSSLSFVEYGGVQETHISQ